MDVSPGARARLADVVASYGELLLRVRARLAALELRIRELLPRRRPAQQRLQQSCGEQCRTPLGRVSDGKPFVCGPSGTV